MEINYDDYYTIEDFGIQIKPRKNCVEVDCTKNNIEESFIRGENKVSISNEVGDVIVVNEDTFDSFLIAIKKIVTEKIKNPYIQLINLVFYPEEINRILAIFTVSDLDSGNISLVPVFGDLEFTVMKNVSKTQH